MTCRVVSRRVASRRREPPVSCLTWCAAADLTEGTFQVRGESVTRAPPEVGFKVLGTQITFNNDASVEVQNVASRLWAAFGRNRSLLTCKYISFVKRLRFLQIVAQQAMWCAGSLNLTSKQCEVLRGVQRHMLRAVIGCKPKPFELDWDFFAMGQTYQRM